MSEAQKGIPKGVTINLGSAGLAYTTSEGDQIISIKKSDYDKLSAENAALSERLRDLERLHDDWVFALERRGIMSCDPGTETYFNGKDSQMQECIEALAAILSKTPKKDNT